MKKSVDMVATGYEWIDLPDLRPREQGNRGRGIGEMFPLSRGI